MVERARAATAGDAGLLMLRIGAGLALALLLAWGGFPNATVAGITGHPWAMGVVVILGALATLGCVTRPAAALLAAAMVWAVVSGWRTGQQFLEEPARALMFAVLYAALALTGPGAWSVDAVVGPNRSTRFIHTVEADLTSVPGDASSTRAQTARARHMPGRTDAGLLVLRLGTGLSLFSLFGLTKIGWVVALARAPDPWSSWPFAQLIRSVGFPAPLIFAFCAVFNETVTPLFLAAGLATRVASIVGMLGMAGAMYTSLRLGEEPIRAAVYVVAFATLAFTGPGRYSVDRLGPRPARRGLAGE